MDDQTNLVDVLQAYGEARGALAPLFANLLLLALLDTAVHTGVLAQARRAQTPAMLASTLHLDETRVTALCDALDAYGVLVREDDAFRLEEHWATLADPELPFPLAAAIDHAFAAMQVLQHALSAPDAFGALPGEVRAALAKGVTVDPTAAMSPQLFQMLLPAISAELDALFTAGARYLELGCGLAGGLLSMLRAYPRLRAVGVEQAADLLRQAERTAAELGVNDRAHFVHGDAREFAGDASFDVVFWSQFFFPTPSRAATLQTARRALKEGGLFVAPLGPEPLAAGADLHTEAGRDLAVYRLLYGAWGIPLVSARDLQREIEGAGFSDVQLVEPPINRFVLATLARRSKA
jgi:SAM-dependent methyltransferase